MHQLFLVSTSALRYVIHVYHVFSNKVSLYNKMSFDLMILNFFNKHFLTYVINISLPFFLFLNISSLTLMIIKCITRLSLEPPNIFSWSYYKMMIIDISNPRNSFIPQLCNICTIKVNMVNCILEFFAEQADFRIYNINFLRS